MRAGEKRRPFWDNCTSTRPIARPSGGDFHKRAFYTTSRRAAARTLFRLQRRGGVIGCALAGAGPAINREARLSAPPGQERHASSRLSFSWLPDGRSSGNGTAGGNTMQRIIEANIVRFKALLADESDPTKRIMLHRLLAEEETALAAAKLEPAEVKKAY